MRELSGKVAVAAFDAQAPRFDGDEYLDTRAMLRRTAP
jgi:hypothetical protein